MSKKQQLRELQRREQRRKTIITVAVIAGAAVVLVGALVIGGLLTRQNLPPLPAPVSSNREFPANAEVNGRAWGPANASIKIEEFMDYQCPVCGSFNKSNEPDIVKALAATGKVRYEIKYLPVVDTITNGRESSDAGQAALCAAEQNKFWPMHNTLFANQFAEGRGTFSKPRIKQIAALVDGLNADTFAACLDGDKNASRVQSDAAEATRRGANSTPTFYINGQRFTAATIPTLDDFKKEIARIAPAISLN